MFNIEQFNTVFSKLYGDDLKALNYHKSRYEKLITTFINHFGDSEFLFFSTPGRTEIGGNHTDHNLGRVLAASVNLDSIAVAAKNNSNQITIYSEGYPSVFIVNLSNLNMNKNETGTTTALIKGIAAKFRELGLKTGGFNACITSEVLQGSGLSSSASIEVLIGTIFNHLFNDGKVQGVEIAKIGKFAENVYFGKPCGLMDQVACAIGGIITIDFKNPEDPMVRRVDFDFGSQNYRLLVVDTGGNHADLTDEYAAVPNEMISVAKILGANVCRDISIESVISNIKEMRSKISDRAILRALHFLQDNERVLKQVQALESGNFHKFLSLVNESGNSSFKWLQNVYSSKNVHKQSVSLALALTEYYLTQIKNPGACRVHGGGFAGTIQVFLHVNNVEQYIILMESVFGKNSVKVLNIRSYGAMQLNSYNK